MLFVWCKKIMHYRFLLIFWFFHFFFTCPFPLDFIIQPSRSLSREEKWKFGEHSAHFTFVQKYVFLCGAWVELISWWQYKLDMVVQWCEYTHYFSYPLYFRLTSEFFPLFSLYLFTFLSPIVFFVGTYKKGKTSYIALFRYAEKSRKI